MTSPGNTINNIINSYKDNTRQFFLERNPYNKVHVLMVWWADTDLQIEREVEALSKLFREDFGYDVSTLKLPENGTQDLILNSELLSFHNRLPDNALLIIFYSGHCDQDQHGYSRWFAREDSDQYLSWHVSQQLLFKTPYDVLLLLDCCHAALVAKGTKQKGRFEMIAACASGCKTIAPSSVSFTRILTKELKRHAETGISVDNLTSIIRENASITATPVFHDFARISNTRIILKRVSGPIPEGFGKRPSLHMILSLSLSDYVKGQELAEWFKTGAPSEVVAANIEAVVPRATRVNDLGTSAFLSGPIFGGLSQRAKDEVLREIHRHSKPGTAAAQDTEENTNIRWLGSEFHTMDLSDHSIWDPRLISEVDHWDSYHKSLLDDLASDA
ncbi:hypothetical protein F5Y13DRAFT_11357 [Hypoxylon sp. FL1857]|nr:hypothetical protein F5Y13DRAFT_11357 [Hypoxylon sp. FL1857]